MTEMKSIHSAKSLKHTLDVIQLIFGVPLRNSKYPKLIIFLGVIIQVFFGYLFIFSQIMNLFSIKDPRDIPANLYMLIEFVTTAIKGACLMYYTKSIWRMLDILDTEQFTVQTENQNKFIVANIKVIKRTSLIYYIGDILCGIMFAVTPIVKGGRLLPQVGWFPFDVKKTPNFQLAFFWLMTAPPIIGYANSAFDLAAAGFMSLGCCQLDVLHDSLTNIYQTAIETLQNRSATFHGTYYKDFDENVDEEIYQELIRKIHHHRLILEYLELLQKVFTIGMFAQLAGSVIVISATTYESVAATSVTDPRFISAMVFEMMMLSQLLFYCWYGSKVYYKTSELANAIYMSDWCKCGIKLRKLFGFMMIRSAHPINITAGNFITVELSTFIAVVKLAYSVYTILQRME